MKTICNPATPYDRLLGRQPILTNERHYRPMNFVIEQPVDNGLLLYHTLTRQMLLLSTAEANAYHMQPATLTPLIEAWFLVPKEHDDRQLSHQIKAVGRMLEPQQAAITSYNILTTTDCNARCFYCYERGRSRIPMSDDVARHTADYIINHCGGQPVELLWFGGEPLYRKSVITLICRQLSDASVRFTSGMTSNAYLFDEETVQEAVDLWRLRNIQITLDGTEDIYNRSKAYINCDGSAYRRVISNIHQLLRSGIHVRIRLNIDIHNADNLLQLVDELHNEFHDTKHMKVYPHPLYGENMKNAALYDDHKRAFMYQRINEIQERIEAYEMAERTHLEHHVKLHQCMADSDHAVVILPTGHLGKCEHYTDSNFYGHIDSNELNTAMLASFRECRDEMEACATCAIYPDCFRLRKCEAISHCYPEMREWATRKIRRAMQATYEKYLKEKEN
ncbi:MAG: radical SAM protein [Prevotella sp.]|nr:radical SAM protein [Prevotella sp.]